jgi:hypothetical protein
MARLIALVITVSLYAASAFAASTNPAARPSPAPRKSARKPVVIHPKTGLPPQRFEVVKTSATQLEIQYVTADPTVTLDTTHSIVIQLNTPRSLVITPSVITSSEWPKGKTKMTLAYKGQATKGVWVDGAATYTICKAKSCKQIETPIRTDFR